MEGFIASKDSSKILKVFLLKTIYEVSRSLDKEVAPTLSSYCLIIRKEPMKNDTEFGYKEQLKTGILKKIHFIYLPHVHDLIAFLWSHVRHEKVISAGIFIDGIDQYFGEKFFSKENYHSIAVYANLLKKLGEKSLGKKGKVKVGFTFTYNSYIFPRMDFIKYMNRLGCSIYELTGQEITKNGESYESEFTKKFFQLYGTALVKSQQN